jgi:hypothetical protein
MQRRGGDWAVAPGRTAASKPWRTVHHMAALVTKNEEEHRLESGGVSIGL